MLTRRHLKVRIDPHRSAGRPYQCAADPNRDLIRGSTTADQPYSHNVLSHLETPLSLIWHVMKVWGKDSDAAETPRVIRARHA